MSTTMLKSGSFERKWYILDAAGKPLGKTAEKAANLLRGKHKVAYTPHVDCGDYVIVLNAEKAVLTGKKLEQKFYRRHSGYPGGLKEVRYDRIMKIKPEFAMMQAVRGMLQKNKLGSAQLTRLRVFRGAEHSHASQKPVAYEG